MKVYTKYIDINSMAYNNNKHSRKMIVKWWFGYVLVELDIRGIFITDVS